LKLLPRRPSLEPSLPDARSLALSTAVALLLAACASDVGGPWWSMRVGIAAEAATEATDGGNVAGNYLAGRAALEAGDFRNAADDFELALAAAPGNIDLRRQVFELRLASGELDRAVATARNLQAADAGTDETTLVLALDATRRNAPGEALSLLQGMGRGDIAGAVQPILLAWAQYAAGAKQKAIDTLASPDPSSGLDRLWSYHRAAMLGLDGRTQDGLAALQRAFPDLAEAPARVLRGGLALQLAAGDRTAADRLIAAAVQANPDDPDMRRLAAAVEAGDPGIAAVRDPKTGMSDALLSISEAFFEQERNVEAMKLARAATLVTPDDPDCWLLAARIALAQSNPAEALRALDRIASGSPLDWSAGLVRARALEDQERIDDAVALLDSMAQREPTRPDSLIAIGDLMRGKDRFAEAEAAYTRAIQRLPVIDRHHWRLLYARGIAYERTKRWPEAEADLLRALELDPEQPLVLNYLGYSWVDQGLNLDRAKEMLNRAVKLRPDDGFIVDSFGWAYYRLGEHEKAVTYLERAVELEPGDPVINDHLGDAYWRVGRQREAKFQWQRALTFEPEPDAVPVIRGKLAKGLADAQPAPG
jgi:tetratricopeptide (TPR) repeat protein